MGTTASIMLGGGGMESDGSTAGSQSSGDGVPSSGNLGNAGKETGGVVVA